MVGLWRAAMASSAAWRGMLSPNRTADGFRGPPQPVQRGGSCVLARSGRHAPPGAPQRRQVQSIRLPWNSITPVFPAAACRPSTFWVMTRCKWPSACRLARASCPGFGCGSHSARKSRRSSQIFPGCRSKPQIVA